MSDTLVAAREAVGRHAWAEARDAFAAADREQPLAPADLQLFADAYWWSGHPDEAVEALERAYAGFLEKGDTDTAAAIAVWLTYLAFRRGAMAVGSGWMAKAERLVEDDPDSPGAAWVSFLRMASALFAGSDMAAAIEHGDQALELARNHGIREIQAMVTSFKGYALVTQGDWRQGMALIDESSAEVVSGEMNLHIASGVYCNTIACCAAMADYRRAGEWTDEAERWMQRRSLGGYPGVCRLHRAELKKLHGSYGEAEQEARAASDELERFHLLDSVGLAHYEIGEIRLRMGDLEAAEESFMRSYEYGWHSQPGMALLMLARGDVEGASKAIAARLKRVSGEEGSPARNLSRARHLPAQVKIALAAGELDTAARAAGELEQIAAEFEQPAFRAAALTARGAVELESGRPEEAAGILDEAWRMWRQIELPYESAQARVLLGRAKAAAGDETTALLELKAARTALEKLGAALDLKQVDEMLGEEVAASRGDGRRVTRTFMFTDIVTSTDLVSLIGDSAWESLIRWHDRALRSEFTRHGGQEVRQTGDGFFVSFERAADAVSAAVAVQRRLAEHRRDHGFAPWVRIGLHTAEATPQGRDYAGHGVHVAARIGDLAEREEIVASADTIEAAGTLGYPVSEPRSVTPKGAGGEVQIHTVDWR